MPGGGAKRECFYCVLRNGSSNIIQVSLSLQRVGIITEISASSQLPYLFQYILGASDVLTLHGINTEWQHILGSILRHFTKMSAFRKFQQRPCSHFNTVIYNTVHSCYDSLLLLFLLTFAINAAV